MNDKVFLGIASVPERTDYLSQVMLAVRDHLLPFVDPPGAARIQIDQEHQGVAVTKNKLLRHALESGADWFFIAEDDIVPQGPKAITGYLDAAKATGIEHLMFAHHGLANARGPVDWAIGDDWRWHVELYPHYVGAWCLYSRRSIETCGLLDEHFVNSWDHVEHTLRLSLAGFHPMPGPDYELRAADAVGSSDWLAEIPGSIENTAIPHTDQWRVDRELGRKYWRENKPETYYLVFGR